MAGILDSITERHTDFRESKNETRQENEIQKEEIICETEKANAKSVGRSGKVQSATPCPTCGACIAWWDIYGGGPHCHRCRDWPNQAVVSRIVAVVRDANDESTRWLTLWQRAGSVSHSEPTDAPQASCVHRRGRNLTIGPWPGCAGEVEMVWECAECGMWFEGKPAGG